MKRLKLTELETWKCKAAACDQALEYLAGRASTDESLEVQRILQGRTPGAEGERTAATLKGKEAE